MALFVLAGDPVEHSASPRMFAAAFAALGIEHTYEARRVDEAGLRALVDSLRRGEIAGMNVTTPHKQLALSLADERDSDAAACGAANVLARMSDHVVAFNTDVAALRDELAALWAVASGRALVIGAGGAARAAVLALVRLGVGRITVRARRASAAAELAKLAPNVTIEPLAAGDDRDVTIVVQATSAGMAGVGRGDEVAAAVGWSRLPSNAVAYDVVYAPPVTPFVEAARARGIRAESGAGMLVAQGALAFERWLGTVAPRAAMTATITGR